jgi:hypothetical protein
VPQAAATTEKGRTKAKEGKARPKAKTKARAARKPELRRAKARLAATGRTEVSAPFPGRTEQKGDVLPSSLLFVLLVAAASLALISVVLAALPLGTLDRLLAVDAHYRAEQIASFVDTHRLDIAMVGVTMLLGVATAAVLQTLTG